MANIGTVDLDVLSQLVISGDLTPVIQETFSLSATASAVALVEAGHVHGKVVVRI